MAKEVRISEELKRYIVDIVRASREIESVKLGASPRASLALMKSSQALALLDGLEYVRPDHIQEISTSVLAHRLILDSEARFSGINSKAIVEDIVGRVPVPV
jgi:MoxR-like ATPase